VIARYEHYPGATFGMTQDSAYHVGMTLTPTPLVLLYLPGINDVTDKIKSVAGIVFEKVV
jgi:hypothetical protein